MNIVLDIIGSMIVRAAMVMIILNLMINLHEALFKSSERNALNTAMTGAMQTISSDLALAGYNSTTKTFPIARRNDMSFRADVDDDDYFDTIRYYVSPNTYGSNKVLYRVETKTVVPSVSFTRTTMEVARDVDTFFMLYYTATGGSVSYGTNRTVKSLVVTLRIASKSTVLTVQAGSADSVARKTTWRQHFFPENL